MSLPTHAELLDDAYGWLMQAERSGNNDGALAYATMAIAASNLAREIRKRPPDAWQAGPNGSPLPAGYADCGPWEIFGETEIERFWRRPLRKVSP